MKHSKNPHKITNTIRVFQNAKKILLNSVSADYIHSTIHSHQHQQTDWDINQPHNHQTTVKIKITEKKKIIMHPSPLYIAQYLQQQG